MSVHTHPEIFCVTFDVVVLIGKTKRVAKVFHHDTCTVYPDDPTKDSHLWGKIRYQVGDKRWEVRNLKRGKSLGFSFHKNPV